MPRRIGTGRCKQGNPRPCRLRSLVCQPMGESIARSGNVGPVPCVGTTRKDTGCCLSNGAGVRAQGNALDVSSIVGRQAQLDHASATARPGRTLKRQTFLPGVFGKTHGSR